MHRLFFLTYVVNKTIYLLNVYSENRHALARLCYSRGSRRGTPLSGTRWQEGHWCAAIARPRFCFRGPHRRDWFWVQLSTAKLLARRSVVSQLGSVTMPSRTAVSRPKSEVSGPVFENQPSPVPPLLEPIWCEFRARGIALLPVGTFNQRFRHMTGEAYP